MNQRAQHHTVEPWAPAPTVPATLVAPGDLWALNKQIDELGGEWSFNAFTPRTTNFHLSRLPIQFYEPLGDFDRVGLEALNSSRARQFGLPEDEIGGLVVDFQAFPSLFNPVDGFIPMPGTEERNIGRHTAQILGPIDQDTLLVRHAWSGWTANGTAKMTREFFDEYAMGVMLTRRWDRGPLAETVSELFKTSNQGDFKKMWRKDREPMFVRDGDSPWRSRRLSAYCTWSLDLEIPAEVLTVTNHAGVRIGVAVILHDRGETLVSDLFVWPPYRRKGIGGLLEGFAEERAFAAGNSSLVAFIWEADAVKGLLRATRFLEARGYEIADSVNTDYVARASREIG